MARKRWMEETIKAAKSDTTKMPWTRGARRAEMIARRKAAEVAKSA